MDSIILGYSFAAAIAISACVVLVFSRSIDRVLTLVVPAEMAPAWNLYVKLGLFTATFVGGLRLNELSELVKPRMSQAPMSGGEGLLEILKTIAGSLIAASGTLLVFFAACLVVYAAYRAYLSYRAEAPVPAPRPIERQPSALERGPVGATRHSGGAPRHSDAQV